jgi:hypothetical protein
MSPGPEQNALAKLRHKWEDNFIMHPNGTE